MTTNVTFFYLNKSMFSYILNKELKDNKYVPKSFLELSVRIKSNNEIKSLNEHVSRKLKKDKNSEKFQNKMYEEKVN